MLLWFVSQYVLFDLTRISKDIINEDEEYELIDITVKPPKSTNRILDDDIYDLFPVVRQYIPRSLCIFTSVTNPQSRCEIVIFGMKKFNGGPGDDDDVKATDEENLDSRHEHYFTQPFDECIKLIDTSKENGGASHLGQVRFLNNDKLYMDSKNVH